MKRYFPILIAVIGLFSSYAYGNPTINSVSGSLVGGVPITIVGSRFGAHALGIEWLGAHIEQSSPGSVLSKAGWVAQTDGGGFTAPRYASAKAHSGRKSILCRIRDADNPATGKWASGFYYDTAGAIDKIYVTWWVRFEKGSEFGQWKKWRLSPTTSVSDTNPQIMQSDWYNNDGSMCQAYVWNWVKNDTFWYPKGDGERWITANDVVPVNSWVRLEYYFEENSAMDARDGTLRYFIHRQSEPVRTVKDYVGNLKTRSAGATYDFHRYVHFQNYWGNQKEGETGNASIYLDDIFVQKGTQARVEIGDSPDWSACTHREIQVPSAWSDGSIKITVNQGSFQAGDTAYLFVVDSDGNVNSTGFPIVIGKRYGGAQSAVALLLSPGVTPK